MCHIIAAYIVIQDIVLLANLDLHLLVKFRYNMTTYVALFNLCRKAVMRHTVLPSLYMVPHSTRQIPYFNCIPITENRAINTWIYSAADTNHNSLQKSGLAPISLTYFLSCSLFFQFLSQCLWMRDCMRLYREHLSSRKNIRNAWECMIEELTYSTLWAVHAHSALQWDMKDPPGSPQQSCTIVHSWGHCTLPSRRPHQSKKNGAAVEFSHIIM